jgi:lysophospholipase L1-like esterase
MRRLLLIATFALIAASPLCARPARAEDRPRPRVVCFGDSITKAGYPQRLAKLLADRHADVTNAGVNGNTTAQALRRMQRDVLDAKPQVVVIFFGTNDCRLAEPKVHVPVDQYRANLQKMIDAVTARGAKPVLCTPPPIDQEAYFTRHARAPFDAAGGLDKVLAQYRAAVLDAADKNHTPLVDLNQLLAKNTDWRSPDGVHPTDQGSDLIAHLILDTVRPLLPATTP